MSERDLCLSVLRSMGIEDAEKWLKPSPSPSYVCAKCGEPNRNRPACIYCGAPRP